MASILDSFPFPFSDPSAQQLHITLAQLHPTPQAALLVAERAGIDTSIIFAQQPPVLIWREILSAAAVNGLTRSLVQTVTDMLNKNSPARPFLEGLLANRTPPVESEPRNADGAPNFFKDTDEISEPEALLYYDDLTMPIGQVEKFITTLQRLVELAPAVCRLVVDVRGMVQYGTGFRIGSDLLLTNWHVLHLNLDETRATAVTAEFRYEDDGKGGGLAPTVAACDVNSIISNKADDWAVIRTRTPIDNAVPIIKLSEATAPEVGKPTYIIQHPKGERKRLGYVRNQVSYFDDRVVHYLTDTQVGSSGSPVINDDGKLIALHHAGGRPQEVLGKKPLKKNEGIIISRVVQGLQEQHIIVS